MDDEMVLEAAAVVHEELRSAGDEDARRLRSRLEPLLERAAAGQPVADEVLEVLTADAGTRQRVAGLLADTDDDGVRSGFSGLPGLPAGSPAPVFSCSTCDYRWPSFEVGEPVPECPRGHGRLERRP